MVLTKYIPKDPPKSYYLTLGEIVIVATIFLMNLYLLLPFFGQPDQINVFSAPFVPVLTLFTDRFVPYIYGVRIWVIASMLLFPLTFYFFVKEMTGRKLAGFLAALVVIIPRGPFLIQRVEQGILGGDGAFMVSLAFIPLVCLATLRFVRRGGFKSVLISSLGTTLVALTSPIGSFVLLICIGVLTFSEMLLGSGRLKFVRFLVILVGAAGFSAFWYNPKFIFLVLNSSQGQLIIQAIFKIIPISFFLVPILGVIGFLIFDNRAHLQPLFVAIFLTLAFGALSWGTEVSMAVSSASRFFVPLGMSIAFLFGVAGTRLYDFLHHSPILEHPKLHYFRVITRKRQEMSVGLASLVFIIFSLGIVFQKDSLYPLGDEDVLGVSSVKRIGIWEIRDQTNSLETLLGFTITAMTITSFYFLKKNLSRQ